jgi:PRTRC genetic system protein B
MSFEVVTNFGRSQREFTLTTAILVYTHAGAAVAMVHPVGKKNKILPGTPAKFSNLSTLMAAVANRDDGFLDEHVLYAKSDVLAWWRPAQRRQLFLSDKLSPLNKKSLWHPPLLFVARDGRLLVFALGRNARPRRDDPLFHAPYPNIFSNGVVCTGNTKFPSVLSPNCVIGFEKMFFGSEFTHFNDKQQTEAFPEGVDALAWWKARRRIPVAKRDLVRFGHLTLSDICTRSIRSF